MPGDVPRGFAQEVFIADVGPQGFNFGAIVVPVREEAQGGVAGFVDPVLFFHRVVEAATQGALGFGVQLA